MHAYAMDNCGRWGILESMPRKTRAQKMHSAHKRVEEGTPPTVSSSTQPIVPQYQESPYDKDLRTVTIKDTTRTLLVTLLLFALQYIVFVKADTIQALFR
jgi:hypothetical protein